MSSPSALIAEDELLLAQALQAELARAWPELKIAGLVGDGTSAITQALALQPDVLFFDIRMPGQTGLEAAAELADAWEADRPFPALVFITAYDQYALQAFDAHAVDYVLKPVQQPRLQKTVARLKEALAARAAQAADGAAQAADGAAQAGLEATLGQLRHLLAATGGAVGYTSTAAASGQPAGPLKVIQASVGASIRMVPVDEVLYFEAADKYVRVLTEGREYLIRTPLKELLPQLDASSFWQIHRGTVVRATAIDTVTRDEAGKAHLTVRGRPEKLPVSRLYAHLFKAM